MHLKFYRDEDGEPRARSQPGDPLAGFLESDLQESTAFARQILKALDDVAAGKADSWEGTGNAYTLTLTRAGASIVPDFDDDGEPHQVALAELRDAIGGWLRFLKSDDED
jgi:hypothetical protein